ncbi:MAG TPA: biotin--[acetyl-CoA-carboxylase] ligase [Sphingomicrobium sp.]|nr:biotin--[acetyl-CoA-carboxylase] ligase [Sphingomicrobium sp.]
MTRIRIVERTGSTNADLLADAGAVEGDWLVALHQSAGKGRQGRSWAAGEGNFFGSTLVGLRPGDPPASSLSLAAGLALIEAADVAVPGQPLILKWPNDLLLGHDKLGGILLERGGDRVVAGFGVNLAAAPQLPDRKAASLSGVVTPQGFAPLLAASFARLLGLWRSSDSASFARAWLERAHPVGSLLTVHTGADDRLSGRFDGIEPDGALRLRTDGGIEVVRAGDVEL